MPEVKEIQVCVFASTGASSGVLERLEVTNFEYLGAEPKLWTAIGSQYVSRAGGRNVDPLDLPTGLESGDAKTLWIRATLNGAPNKAGAYAEQIRGLRGIRVKVEWTYARTRAPYWALVPTRWRPQRRQEKTHSTIAELDCSNFRTDVIRFWERRDHHHVRLAAIAKGEETEPSSTA